MTLRKLLALGLLIGTPVGAQTLSAVDAFHAEGARAAKPTATIPYGPDPLQTGDLRLPEGKGPFPVAMIIHGGCWLANVDNKAGTAAVAEALTRRGIATWNVEYRRIGDAGGGWPGTFKDIAAAEDKLTQIARLFPLDLKRVTIVGHSAGAHLALWAASRARLPAPWSPPGVRPQSVVAIDGPAALAPFIGADKEACGQSVIEPLMGGAPNLHAAEYRIASPAEHLPLGVKQLLVTGVFRPFIEPYKVAVKHSSDPLLSLDPAGANHFNIVTPSTPIGASVIDFIVKNAF
ncbi:acetyl esterase/lipase [Sphingomonas vulcanisoli]|uniref:Acetyl esterase/lipase n=1 Tax=Sphingomonas vulcanisoli TaxID=1658060 RepID=A0ABX0TPM1_9SPHN|nr:alpha/beta hydrolase [Sphingomonas vulcanisoli]NIJ07371.1 acetyl esterase/lipase [Sphingomonas vulcanisoli]